MSVHVIKVPDLGEGIAEVELVAWRVEAGQVIAEDQILADVMTDKATVEIPSPVAGKVQALGGEIGQMLAVGAELIRIDTGAEGSPAAANAPAPAAPTPQLPPPTAPPASTPQLPPTPTPAASALATPVAPAAPTMRATPAVAAAPRRPIASPALRARAWELGVDLSQVVPSGPGGRIMQRDLDAHAGADASRSPPPLPAPAQVQAQARVLPTPASTPRLGDPVPAGATHAEKIVGMRRRIAQKMQESKRRIPHYTYVEEVDVGEVEALRARLNETWGEQRAHLTLLAFLIRALVLAVREVPQVNALFDDEAGIVTRHDAVHIGIATQTDNGLMVPVLRHAEALDLWAGAAEVLRLAQAARSGKIVRDELLGSTITITSLGRLGGIASTPVINHPEVAIVGVNRIVERPVIRAGAVVARPLMNLSSSFDHRVVDGAQAAAFIQAVRVRLEHPALLFMG